MCVEVWRHEVPAARLLSHFVGENVIEDHLAHGSKLKNASITVQK